MIYRFEYALDKNRWYEYDDRGNEGYYRYHGVFTTSWIKYNSNSPADHLLEFKRNMQTTNYELQKVTVNPALSQQYSSHVFGLGGNAWGKIEGSFYTGPATVTLTIKNCECGASFTSNSNCHSTWCPLFGKSKI